MAVTPEAVPAAPRVRPPHGRGRLVAVGLVIAVAVGLLLWQGLGENTVYFHTASEAVAKRTELGDRRIKVMGVVVPGSEQQVGDERRFQISENGVTVPVVYRGTPPALFQGEIPVVLEGSFRGDTFVSTEMLVKHTEQYSPPRPAQR